MIERSISFKEAQKRALKAAVAYMEGGKPASIWGGLFHGEKGKKRAEKLKQYLEKIEPKDHMALLALFIALLGEEPGLFDCFLGGSSRLSDLVIEEWFTKEASYTCRLVAQELLQKASKNYTPVDRCFIKESVKKLNGLLENKDRTDIDLAYLPSSLKAEFESRSIDWLSTLLETLPKELVKQIKSFLGDEWVLFPKVEEIMSSKEDKKPSFEVMATPSFFGLKDHKENFCSRAAEKPSCLIQ